MIAGGACGERAGEWPLHVDQLNKSNRASSLSILLKIKIMWWSDSAIGILRNHANPP